MFPIAQQLGTSLQSGVNKAGKFTQADFDSSTIEQLTEKITGQIKFSPLSIDVQSRKAEPVVVSQPVKGPPQLRQILS